LLIVFFIGITGYEVPGMVQKKQFRELAVFSGLLILGFVISILQIVGVTLPNPIKGIETLGDYLIRLVK
jgi:hypothetical protein